MITCVHRPTSADLDQAATELTLLGDPLAATYTEINRRAAASATWKWRRAYEPLTNAGRLIRWHERWQSQKDQSL